MAMHYNSVLLLLHEGACHWHDECWDVAILNWCGHTWSAGVWSISCRTKLLETASQAADGGEMCIAPYSNSSDGHPNIQHANSTLHHDLIVTSVEFRSLTNFDILGWPFIVPSIRSVCIMVTLC